MSGITEALFLSPALQQRILDHAREALPMEAVGLLGGQPNGWVERVIPLPNLAGSKTFIADPFAQFQAEKALKQAGLALLAVYHSHPGGGAQLSDADRLLASPKATIQVVIALARPHLPGEEIRAYRMQDGQTIEVQVRPEIS
ncbi:MAG TPA: M67 family metallopeptidase [Anaerolineales bacterium]